MLEDKIKEYLDSQDCLPFDIVAHNIAEIAIKETDAYEDTACLYAMLQVKYDELKKENADLKKEVALQKEQVAFYSNDNNGGDGFRMGR